jgi:hypothetical protein
MLLNRIAFENDRIAGTRDKHGRKVTLKKSSEEEEDEAMGGSGEQQQKKKKQRRRRCEDSDEEGGIFVDDDDDQSSETARVDQARLALLARCPGLDPRSSLHNKLEALFDILLQPTLFTYRQIRDDLNDDPP